VDRVEFEGAGIWCRANGERSRVTGSGAGAKMEFDGPDGAGGGGRRWGTAGMVMGL
jgi:hypothetical protein